MEIEYKRYNWLIIGVIITSVILIARLFYIQIIDDKYKINASNNAFKYETLYPARGIVYDRNMNILIGNATSYDIIITPYEVLEPDTAALCEIFGMDSLSVRSVLKGYRENRKKIGYRSFPFIKQATREQYAQFLEKAYKFSGFDAVSRTIRNYPVNAGGNLLGYITEVDQNYIKTHPEYKSGDYAGRTGIEQSYEDVLRGKKGYKIYLRDVNNKIKSSFENGSHDIEAVPGKNLISGIDTELQQYGELLMQNKKGSIVAIEPSSGEILALISSPGIEVSKLAEINKYYNEIITNPLKPMYNRAVMAPYPPGSIFKTVNALIAQQEGVVDKNTQFSCNMGYPVGRGVECHAHPSPINLRQSIMMSCNTYYCYTFRRIVDNNKYSSVRDGLSAWKKYTESFCIGKKTGSDLPGEKSGSLPSPDYYDKLHGKNRWNSLSIISLAIGQGEIGMTPLQMANLAAIIANRGYYYTPHLIRGSLDTLINTDFNVKRKTMIDSKYFEEVVEGMYLAVNCAPGAGGTATAAACPGLDICGKTGTAQNPHGENHSVFICFAPKDDPKIAIAVFVENSGYGGTWAAPIGSLMVERYLNKTIARQYLEERISNAKFL